MSQNKNAYFQGTEEPTPKKKKYKSEKAILIQPRFKEPFYRNFDLYDVDGVDGEPKLGPGAGWNHMHKYKSIQEFRDAKRKYMKNKYKADDFWIEDNESNRKQRIKNMKVRASFINLIVKTAIDFPVDEQVEDSFINWESGSYNDGAQIGGNLDEYLPENDFEGKDPSKLNFGRDYVEDKSADIDTLIEKYLNPAEPPIYGLPDGISPQEDLDSPSTEQLQYGETDSGNTFYNEMWI